MTIPPQTPRPDPKIDFQQLLGRSPIALNMQTIQSKLHDKVILVTGAAGSIGSEICAQVATCGPRALIAFDQAETPLFHLERNLAKNFPKLAFHAEIGNITRFDDVRRAMYEHHPSILFHAAGLKHVPLMERHIFAAIETNLFGTWLAAEAAAANDVEYFILVSTDKAVRPTSVMGATKRAAEMVLCATEREGGTRFASVRLGNVLGSNGSVTAIFNEQIAAGGPLTVTHPEMERFLMTLHEAGQVVLYAALVAEGGEIFVPRLGYPVKILDLAEKLIRLHGQEPNRDIKIEITGMRPGEKLSEELFLPHEELTSASQVEISIIRPGDEFEIRPLRGFRGKLQKAISIQDRSRAIALLAEMVPEYNPHSQLLESAI